MDARTWSAVASLGFFGSVIHGQTVSEAILVAEGSTHRAWMEPAIIASPMNVNHVALVIQDRATGGGLTHGVHYIFTESGFIDWEEAEPWPIPTNTCGGQASFDPMVAASAATGDLYIGCIFGSKPSIMHKPFDEPFSDSIHIWPCEFGSSNNPPQVAGWDKPFMAMGPWPPGTSATLPETLHVGAFVAAAVQPAYALASFSSHSQDTTPPGMSWSTNDVDVRTVNSHGSDPGSTSYAFGWFPLVVPEGGTVAGRVIGFYIDRHGDWDPEDRVIAATYSDTGGDPAGSVRRWNEAYRFDSFGPPLGEESIYAASIALNNNYIAHRSPSAAFDPSDPDTVYVAFVASTTSDGLTRDIFVARGITDTQANNELVFTAADTVRITDAMIQPGVSEGTTNEFNVSIAIDHVGGVNLLYSREQANIDGTETVAVRYARWSGWSSLAAGDPANFVSSFTPNFASLTTNGNDYQMLALAGCKLYAAYASKENGVWDMFVRVIEIESPCAEADLNGSGHVSIADVAAFNAAFAAGKAIADRDRNGQINTADAVRFLDAYTQASAP